MDVIEADAGEVCREPARESHRTTGTIGHDTTLPIAALQDVAIAMRDLQLEPNPRAEP